MLKGQSYVTLKKGNASIILEESPYVMLNGAIHHNKRNMATPLLIKGAIHLLLHIKGTISWQDSYVDAILEITQDTLCIAAHMHDYKPFNLTFFFIKCTHI